MVPRRYRNLYHGSVKTTLDLNDTLLATAKAVAARKRTTLTRLVEEGLQLRLRSAGRSRGGKAAVPSIPVYRGKGGLHAGIDPSSNRALLDAAEGPAPAGFDT